MENILNKMSVVYSLSDAAKELKKIIPVTIIATALFTLIFHSAMLASALGVSVSKASEIAGAAYKAWKAGKSIRAAVSALTGPGAIVSVAVSFILGWGVQKVLGSKWLKAM